MKSNKISKKDSFKLRMTLLKLWTMKNIIIVIRMAVVLAVTILVWVITWEEGLGFDKLEIGVKAIITVVVSIASTLFTIKKILNRVNRLTIKDITDKNTKISLVRSGYVFGSDGFLTKKKINQLEKASRTDIDGDGYIAEEVPVKNIRTEPLIQGGVRSTNELATILTTPIETEEDAANILAVTDMIHVAEAAAEDTDDVIEDEDIGASESLEEIVENHRKFFITYKMKVFMKKIFGVYKRKERAAKIAKDAKKADVEKVVLKTKKDVRLEKRAERAKVKEMKKQEKMKAAELNKKEKEAKALKAKKAKAEKPAKVKEQKVEPRTKAEKPTSGNKENKSAQPAKATSNESAAANRIRTSGVEALLNRGRRR